MKTFLSEKNLQQTYEDAEQELQKGFTLVEVVIAMLVLMIAIMGVFMSFTYAVNYNAGNSARSDALAIMQQEVETIRAAKFTPAITDSTLTGGTKTPKPVTGSSQNKFRVEIFVDDDPYTNGIQVDSTKTIKEIEVRVTLDSPTPGWQTAVPARVVFQRVRAN